MCVDETYTSQNKTDGTTSTGVTDLLLEPQHSSTLPYLKIGGFDHESWTLYTIGEETLSGTEDERDRN